MSYAPSTTTHSKNSPSQYASLRERPEASVESGYFLISPTLEDDWFRDDMLQQKDKSGDDDHWAPQDLSLVTQAVLGEAWEESLPKHVAAYDGHDISDPSQVSGVDAAAQLQKESVVQDSSELQNKGFDKQAPTCAGRSDSSAVCLSRQAREGVPGLAECDYCANKRKFLATLPPKAESSRDALRRAEEIEKMPLAASPTSPIRRRTSTARRRSRMQRNEEEDDEDVGPREEGGVSPSGNSFHEPADQAVNPLSPRACNICAEEQPIGAFQSRMTSTCTHDFSACSHCIQQWIHTQLTEAGWDKIKCLECAQFLQYEDVRRHGATDDFDRYDHLAVRAAVSSDPDFFWCQGPSCTSGQSHVGGENEPLFECRACRFRYCIIHRVAWHENETCTAFDRRIRGEPPVVEGHWTEEPAVHLQIYAQNQRDSFFPDQEERGRSPERLAMQARIAESDYALAMRLAAEGEDTSDSEMHFHDSDQEYSYKHADSNAGSSSAASSVLPDRRRSVRAKRFMKKIVLKDPPNPTMPPSTNIDARSQWAGDVEQDLDSSTRDRRTSRSSRTGSFIKKIISKDFSNSGDNARVMAYARRDNSAEDEQYARDLQRQIDEEEAYLVSGVFPPSSGVE